MKIGNLLKIYRLSINPPYNPKDIFILLGTIFILILIPLTALAVITNRGTTSKAVGTASISLSPATLSVNHNTSFTVEIRENSGTEIINGVQANLTYDDNALDFVSIDTTTSAFGLSFEETGGNGSVRIARTSINPLTGNQLVAKVTFTAKSISGNTAINFAPGTTIVRESDNEDVLGTMIDGLYTIVDPPPTVNITSPANNQVVSDTIIVAATANDDLAVTKVEFRVDGTLKGTDTAAPYNYSLDTTTLTNTTHTVQARAYDVNSFTNDQINISVDNQAPTAPTGLTALAISGSQINLSWNASSDNISVTGYDVYRDGSKITSASTTSYSDTGLVEGTTYNYYVIAKDGQGNESAQSTTVSATTQIVGDLNGDGKVNIFDASIMTSEWGTSGPTADLNQDGIVNIFDASILTANWTG